MANVKLQYIGRVVKGSATAPRMWNVLSPRIPGYDYRLGYPTFGIETLKRLGLVMLAISCIVSGNLMFCTDTETGQSWTVMTMGGF